MAVPLELIAIVPAMMAILSLAIHYRLAMRSDSGLFAHHLLIALAIAAATIAVSMAPADPAAQAVADTGVMLAGVLAFAASGWLLFAFDVAGDASGR